MGQDPTEGKNLPFGVEYARSSRATCKGCKNSIQQDTLRMSVREPSRHFDGLQDNWFHFACFWKRIIPGKVEINEKSIKGIDTIRWDDQEKIREQIAGVESGDLLEAKSFSALKVEYAKSSRGKCSKCKLAIAQKEIKFAKHTSWFHQKCLFIDMKYDGEIKDIEGFGQLTDEDKLALQDSLKEFQQLKQEIAAEPKKKGRKGAKKRPAAKDEMNGDENSAKKAKNGTDDANKKALKKQADIMWQLREGFKQNVSKQLMEDLLSDNEQHIPAGEKNVLELLVDCAVFGSCAPCPKCGGQLLFNSSLRTYECDGQLSEYTKCTYKNENPERRKFVIPKIYKGNDYLKKLKVNLLPKRTYNEALAKETVVGHSDKFKRFGSRGDTTSEEGIDGKCLGVSKGLSRVIVKDGAVVDQECEYAEVAHVYRSKEGLLYSATLGYVDTQTNRNSYYKIQLLKHDSKEIYYLFRSWGRVGTTVGGKKTETISNDSAIGAFERLFHEKTGNAWKRKDYFTKQPGLMDLIETDFTEIEDVKTSDITPGSKTTLDPPIKDIILMIFDKEQLKKTMLGFQLDLDKMPLGKLSKKQIMNAYSVLTELQQMMSKEADPDKVLDATNRFYTLIPHSFGMDTPPLLNTPEIIKEKCGMLDSLLEIQIAYEVIKDERLNADGERDPVDVHYEKLKCKMEVVDRRSSEFNTIRTYMANTHGKTHNWYKLEIVDLIRVDREGEQEKFKSDIGNRRLLWHGSMTTNYGGILSQGLRIAPPEAPVTGYMFGKGVYFADMVSKSANYCRVGQGEDGLMLLCDVALGKVKPEVNAAMHSLETIEGYNSVQGLGSTEPNPNKLVKTVDGYAIHMGKPVDAHQDKNCTLYYNEFIVYDVDQIRMRYLVRVRFKENNKYY
ncbi:Poly(ADP-ribose) polymerase catalytic domain protein [Ancylostoma caninum]|uniref:Poly [ADP-ribose] polymerase n=1 Tax=Ancylostoma caninum TaxID=29170 RepID=A0A368GJZ0_ANCCA|nr:Poly(ADP-ribose) polymerase catalytic domain protein [Ancylostoma caninum]